MSALNSNAHCNGFHAADEDEIVISGISGRFPESDNLEEFKQHLFAGTDLVTDDGRRWTPGLYGLPPRAGKLKDLKHFDAQFFGIHSKLANVMCPSLRLLHETTYETIVDAGYNPGELRGSRTAVLVAVTQSESADYWNGVKERVNGYGTLGCSRSMFANRLSFSFDFNGPSYAIDSACSSSFIALYQGFEAIRSGECEAALIGGVHLNLKPGESLHLHVLGMLSADGTCKSFDSSGAGYVRSEAVVTILLQKRKAARRAYATVLNVGINADGYKEQGITYPAGRMQKELIGRIYEQENINPHDVTYFEAHGTGTRVGDPEELDSVAEFFCTNRKEPLLIGGIKSNMGHSESSSGLCSLAKVLIAMESGVIPGNLHFKEPNRDIAGLLDGRLKVVDKNTPWKGGLVGINSVGFGGTNGHVVLRPNPKEKAPAKAITTGDKIPRVVTVSGRTEEAVNAILDQVEKVADDEEFLSLLAETHKSNINGHDFRGYALLGAPDTPREVAVSNGEKRPIWWVFSGMGSQWPGMAKSLYRLEVFRKSIDRSAAALKPHGFDLIDIVTNATAETLEECTNSAVAITAIQVAFTDVLTALGIVPDFFVGHSLGELGCAYADGTITAEQAVLASYFRGRASIEGKIMGYAMAAVGLTWEETKRRCPPGVYPACHNNENSSSISGTKEGIAKFVAELQAEGIFAKEIKSAGIAAHSKYVYNALPMLTKYYTELIPDPKPRSARWISSSIPEERWGEPLAKLSSVEYHLNNVKNPVLFAETLHKIADNAIVIELAPDWFFQSILRRSVGKNVTLIGLNKRYHPDGLSFFLNSVGKMYNAGLQPDLSCLYKPVPYPVSRGTQQIASLVKWDHSTEWAVPNFEEKSNRSGESVTKIDLADEKDAFLAGNSINGRVMFPASGYLTLVWRTFAKLQGKSAEDLPVTIENVQFHRETVLPKEGPVNLVVNVFDGSGQFEVCEEGSVVVSGRIAIPEDPENSWVNLPNPPSSHGELPLKTADVYKELRLRGYDLTGLFCGILTSDTYGTMGRLQWADEWISFMDTMFQFSVLGMESNKIFLPRFIDRININPLRHKLAISHQVEPQTELDIIVNRDCDIIQAGGVEIHGLKTTFVPRQLYSTQAPPKFERCIFVPLNGVRATKEEDDTTRVAAITSLLQIISENSGGALKLKAVEVEGDRGAMLGPLVIKIFEVEPTLVLEVALSSSEPLTQSLTDLGIKQLSPKTSGPFESPAGTHFIITTDLSKRADPTLWKKISESLRPGGFVLAEEVGSAGFSVPQDSGLVEVSKLWANKYSYTLLRKVEIPSQYRVFKVDNIDLSWLEPLKKAMKECKDKEDRILLVSQGDKFSGLAGFIPSLIKEPGSLNVRSMLILDPKAPAFSLTAPVYAKQLKLDLVNNILKHEWGTFRNIPLGITGDVASRQVEHAYINALSHGDLTSLRWIEGPSSSYRSKKYPGKELCTVHYAPLGFCDIKLIIRNVTQDSFPDMRVGQDYNLGREFSGYDSRGRRVIGVVASGSLATSVLADPEFLWEVPDSWTLEQAATVPLCHATAYYALVVRGCMRKGETLLIHDGAASLGQAAIAIALHAGCTVYTTAGTPEKKDVVKKRFPELTDDHIVSSPESTFAPFILQATKGRGVDLVFNFPTNHTIQVSASCLAKYGRYLHISNNVPRDAGAFLQHKTLHSILPEALFATTGKEKADIVRLLSEGIKSGVVRPFPSTVFNKNSLEEAFRTVATNKPLGRVLIQVRTDDESRGSKPTTKIVSAVPRTYMDPDKSYAIVGGLGGFGVELVNWLISRGATKCVIASRGGVKNGYQALCLRRWRQAGIKVNVTSSDVRTEKGAHDLLNECKQLGPVGGIFNVAMVVRDAYLESQTESDFGAVTSPKIAGTINLDKASRSLCPQLDYFVAFSSVTSNRGLAGQVAYSFANSAMERICEARQADGLPATAVEWGSLGDVGFIIESMGGDNYAVVGGTLPQRVPSLLNALNIFLQQPDPILTSIVVAEKKRAAVGDTSVGPVDAVARILGIKDPKSVRANQNLQDMGMDSIMSTEVKDTLERNYGIYLNTEEIRGLTFSTLQSLHQEEAAT